MTLSLGLVAAHASHTTITSTTNYYSADSPWNGYKVYLSAPRHSDSRSRGECGWEENINGRHWNYYAGVVNTGGSGGFKQRHYKVAVSANARDNGWRINRDQSNNWGANVHLVTHTNANVGCGDSAQYLLVMFRSGNNRSKYLRNHLIEKLNPVVPGGKNTWDCDHLGECYAQAGHKAYVELFFHTNRNAVNWYQSGNYGIAANESWRYGYAVDDHLGYPR